jgi:DNA replication licensing factor MCM2
MQVNVTETVYRNYQKITLQESPGSVQAGRLPRHREVVLLHDLIDCARPGEEIQVTGDICSPAAHLVVSDAQRIIAVC